jgi:hypothetical protein
MEQDSCCVGQDIQITEYMDHYLWLALYLTIGAAVAMALAHLVDWLDQNMT